MNLLQIRTQFIKENGRYDLVVDTTNYADNGADYYIQAGQRFLDNRQPTPKSIKRYQVDIVSGDIFAKVLNLRAIKEVWVMDGDGRYQLIKKPLGWIRDYYAEASANVATGEPLYYNETVIGLSPDIDSAVASDYSTSANSQAFTSQTSVTVTHNLGFYPLVWMKDSNGVKMEGFIQHTSTNEFVVMFAVATSGTIYYGGAEGTTAFTYDDEDLVLAGTTPHYAYRGIVWMPPADGTYTLEVWGDFFSKKLVDNYDTNFWATIYPDILIKAANYALESTYRNTAGMADWLSVIDNDLRGIDHNLVEQDISGVNQMNEGDVD